MAFEKLRASPCFAEVNTKLEAGVACERVAEWAQDEKGCYDDVKRDSLVRTLYRYKKEQVPVTAAQVIAQTAADGKPTLHIWKRIEEMKRGINELDELEKLYLLQTTRISQGAELEQRINYPSKDTRRDIELAAVILEKMTDLKMRLGIYQEAAKNVNLNASVRSDRFGLDKLDPEKRQRLAETARVLMDKLLTAGPAVPVAVPSAPGELVPVAPSEPEDADFEVLADDAPAV